MVKSRSMTDKIPKIREIGIVDVDFGQNVTVIQPSNLYGCTIGDDCFVGPFVEVQKNSKIGDRTRIQSHCFICELVEIGSDCFIGHGVMFINDWFQTGRPAYDDVDLWVPTILKNNVTIGSNATILPVSICENVVIGAGAVVTNDITIPGIYVGSPARLARQIKPEIDE